MGDFLQYLKEKEEKEDVYKITVVVKDPAKSMEKLLKTIEAVGNVGHSFSIVVDPDGDKSETIDWDGDGPAKIKSIEVEEMSEEEADEEHAEHEASETPEEEAEEDKIPE